MHLKGIEDHAEAFFWKDTRTNYYIGSDCADQTGSDPESCSGTTWILA